LFEGARISAPFNCNTSQSVIRIIIIMISVPFSNGLYYIIYVVNKSFHIGLVATYVDQHHRRDLGGAIGGKKYPKLHFSSCWHKSQSHQGYCYIFNFKLNWSLCYLSTTSWNSLCSFLLLANYYFIVQDVLCKASCRAVLIK
jgi:hypothetical protein